MTLIAGTGVVAGDFTQILADFGTTVSYRVVTKTKDAMTGDETSTFAAAVDKTVIFFREDNRYIWDKEGLLQVGDAYIIAATGEGIKRYDQFVVDSETFYIENVIRRHVVGVAMMDFGVCFKVA